MSQKHTQRNLLETQMHLILWDFLGKNRSLRYPDFPAHPSIPFSL